MERHLRWYFLPDEEGQVAELSSVSKKLFEEKQVKE